MIVVLPENVVSQIAAGEVVERPAQLVKELVENSIDAGAEHIEIEYSKGGRTVRVTDDGRGIEASELPLALARHATSKIRDAADLFRLNSFGFRGEALSAISAVSRMDIVSRTLQAETAHRMSSEFGKVSGPNPSGGKFGTSIEISDLFENIPARLKFLKTEAGESSQIKNVLKAMAMAHPQVEIKIKSEGRLVAYWPKANSRLERVKAILEIEDMYEGSSESGSVKVRAVVASPHSIQKNSRNLWLFAQNRPIQDRSLQVAVFEAYRNLLMHGEFPIAAVFVEVAPESIDVNIHPSKSQVKFQDAASVFRAVANTVRSILEPAPWLKYETRSEEAAPVVAAPRIDYHNLNLNFSAPEFSKTQLNQKTTISPTTVPNVAPQTRADVFVKQERAVGPWSQLQVLGQANQTYILAQSEKSLVMIDQHAAHERVAFEKLMAKVRGGYLDVQDYLLPITVELEKSQAEALMKIADNLKIFGINIECLGPETLGVTSAPTLINEDRLVTSLKQMAEEAEERGNSFAVEKQMADICATLACHSVVRAGQALSHEQMVALLEEMDQFSFSSFCPHGRPVSVEVPFSKIEKDFGRTL